MYFSGIDLGSTMTKVVIIDENSFVLSSVISYTSPEHRSLANKVMEEALDRAGLSLSEIAYIVATGYGRINVPFADRQITEISCHARGVSFLFPQARTVIDIGGQDCKGIKLLNGRAVDFVMNDKCAAGTGRFLEVIAESLGLRVEELGGISFKSKNPVRISNTCTIFAEQEVVFQLAEGVRIEDIVAGLHEAIAGRIWAMVAKIKVEREVVITGGGAKNKGLVHSLEKKLEVPVLIPEEPLITGALGAALLGKEIFFKAGKPPIKERRLERARLF